MRGDPIAMLVIDSTLYIDWLRSRRDPVRELGPWIEADEILTCGIIRCEVLRGITHRRVLSHMTELFEILIEVPIVSGTWREIAALAWKMDRKGIVLPLTDIAIGACALAFNATVVTTDPHFARIPGLTVQTQLPAC